MKKIIIILILTGLVSMSVMAEKVDLTNQFTEGWAFAASVETRAGYNLDSKQFGLKGKTVVNISKTFYDKNTTFEEDAAQKVRGKIVITDLEVTVETKDQANDYSSVSGTTNKGILDINWESVIAWVYFGPSLYIKMGDINSHEVRYVDTISDSDFTVVGYSMITPYFTGTRSGRMDYNPATVEDKDSQAIKNVSIVADNLKTFAIGFDMPKKFKTELGFAMRYNYLEKISDPYNSYNINAKVELYAMEEKLKIKVKADAVSGEKSGYKDSYDRGVASGNDLNDSNIDRGIGGITTSGNPLTVGGQISYTHALGKFNLTPAVGFEMQFEEKRKVHPTLSPYAFKSGSAVDKTDLGSFANMKGTGYYTTMTTPMEVGFGLGFNWKSLGLSAADGGIAFANGDKTVTDGVSLSGFVGKSPYAPIPDIAMPYYGVQLSYWESEATDKPGLIPGVAWVIVGNVNVSPGGKYDLKEYANNNERGTRYKTYELTLGNRIDAGLGSEISYKINKFKPYTGVIYKILDITGETETINTEVDGGDKAEYSAYIADRYTTAGNVLSQRTDLRLRFGTDITVTDKVSINAEWASGNIVGSTLTKDALNRAYDSYDYFENNAASDDNNPMAGSDARAGIMSVGLKVKF